MEGLRCDSSETARPPQRNRRLNSTVPKSRCPGGLLVYGSREHCACPCLSVVPFRQCYLRISEWSRTWCQTSRRRSVMVSRKSRIRSAPQERMYERTGERFFDDVGRQAAKEIRDGFTVIHQERLSERIGEQSVDSFGRQAMQFSRPH